MHIAINILYGKKMLNNKNKRLILYRSFLYKNIFMKVINYGKIKSLFYKGITPEAMIKVFNKLNIKLNCL